MSIQDVIVIFILIVLLSIGLVSINKFNDKMHYGDCIELDGCEFSRCMLDKTDVKNGRYLTYFNSVLLCYGDEDYEP